VAHGLVPRVSGTLRPMMSGTTSSGAPPQPGDTDRRRTRWDEHRRTREVELVDAAVAAIRTHGAGVGMEEVAAQAGTSKAAVYRYFADRHQLYLAVCTRVSDHLVEQLRTVLGDHAGPRRQLSAAIDVYLRVIEADPQLYRFVVHRPLSGDLDPDDPVRGLSALVGEHVAGVIAAGLADAGLDTAPAGPWGHGIVGLVRSAADHWLDGGSPISREDLRDHLTRLAWSGLAGIVAVASRPPDSATSPERTS
jgi:AcrR family transcriptional regulator